MGSELPHRGGGRHTLHTNAAALNAGPASNAPAPNDEIRIDVWYVESKAKA